MSQVKGRCILTKEQRNKWIQKNWKHGTLVFKHYDDYQGGGCRVYNLRGEIYKGLSAGGCGYDRQGKVLGNVIMFLFEEQLKKLNSDEFYGIFFYSRKGKGRYLKHYSEGCNMYIDGACGQSSMKDILRKIGFSLRYVAETRLTTTYVLEAV